MVLLYFLRSEKSQDLLVQVGDSTDKVSEEVLIALRLQVTSLRHSAQIRLLNKRLCCASTVIVEVVPLLVHYVCELLHQVSFSSQSLTESPSSHCEVVGKASLLKSHHCVVRVPSLSCTREHCYISGFCCQHRACMSQASCTSIGFSNCFEKCCAVFRSFTCSTYVFTNNSFKFALLILVHLV